MDAVTLGMARADASKKYARRASTVVIYGDSITANNGPTTSGSVTAMNSNGYWTWATRRLGHRLVLLKNAGISGETSAQILARFNTDVAAYKPGYVVVLAGRNDGAIGGPATQANLAKIYDLCASIGAFVVACTLTPGNTLATGQRQADNQTNQWIKRQALVRPNFVVADFAAVLQDTNGNFVTPSLSLDGTHPVTLGAQRMGRVLAAVLDPIVPKADLHVSNNDDAACLVTNPLMFGTGGTLNNGGTGTLAASWQAGIVGTGGTYTVAQVPCADLPNLSWQELNVTATGTGGGQIFQFADTKAVPLAGNGKLYQAQVEFEADPWTSPVYLAGQSTGLYLNVNCSNSSFSSLAQARDLAASNAEVYPLEGQDRAGVLRTPPFQIPANTAHVQVAVNLFAVGKVRVRRFDLREKL